MVIPRESSNEEITETEIALVESELSVKLPQSYIDLMRRWNGGRLEQEHQILAVEAADDLSYYLPEGVWKVNDIAGISLSEGPHSILQTTFMIKEWELPPDLVLLSGDGHTWIAFDYRKSDIDPPVIFIETDQNRTAILAENFQDFIDRTVVSPCSE